MKKKITFIACFILLITVLFACKKEAGNNKTPVNNTLRLFQFNTSGFTTSIAPIINGNSNNLKINNYGDNTDFYSDSVKYLLYLLLDNTNKIVRGKVYKYDAAGFGTIKDSIASGTYTAIFAAAPVPVVYGFDMLTYSFMGDPPLTIKQFPPMFFKKLSLTVGSVNATQSVELTRITSKLQVVIKDALPANAGYVKVKVAGEMGQFLFATEQPRLETIQEKDNRGNILTFTYNQPEDVCVNYFNGNTGVVNFTTSPISILNTITPMTVTIGVYTSDNVLIALKTISNITFQRNTLIVLSGNMFTNSSSGGSGFDVHYSTGLADSTTVRF